MSSRRTATFVSTTAICAISLVIALLAPASGAAPVLPPPHVRYPVIGCNDPKHPFQNHFSWRYAPSACEAGGSLGSLEGIAGARWCGWGRRQATATGQLVDGLGFTYPATITAYDLYKTTRLRGNKYAAWYRRLRVVAKRAYRGGIFRGPFNVVIDVEPQL